MDELKNEEQDGQDIGESRISIGEDTNGVLQTTMNYDLLDDFLREEDSVLSIEDSKVEAKRRKMLRDGVLTRS